VRERCTQCDSDVREGNGYEGPMGEQLCGPCYFAVWGPTGAAEISRAVELLTPAAEPQPRRGWFR
jgi:hypothetical protein